MHTFLSPLFCPEFELLLCFLPIQLSRTKVCLIDNFHCLFTHLSDCQGLLGAVSARNVSSLYLVIYDCVVIGPSGSSGGLQSLAMEVCVIMMAMIKGTPFGKK